MPNATVSFQMSITGASFRVPAAKRARLTQHDDSDSGDDDDDVPLLRFARHRPAAGQSSGSTAPLRRRLAAPGGRSRSLASYVRSRGSCDARSRPGAAWRSEPSRDVAVERSRIHRALRLRTFANHAAPLRTRLDHVDSSDAENGIPARRRGRIASMAFNSNGAYLASGDKDGYIQLHDFDEVFHNDRVAVARTAPARTMATWQQDAPSTSSAGARGRATRLQCRTASSERSASLTSLGAETIQRTFSSLKALRAALAACSAKRQVAPHTAAASSASSQTVRTPSPPSTAQGRCGCGTCALREAGWTSLRSGRSLRS